MTDLEIAKKAFEEKNWAEGIAAAQKTDLMDPWILFYMGYCYDFGLGVEKDSAEAMKWYLKSAAGGDSDAMRNIGGLYQKGHGVEKDPKKAFEWFLKAAKAKNGRAADLTGDCYWNGTGVEVDFAAALKWYRLGAIMGVTDSMYSIGWAYEHGKGVEKDLEKAVKWYERAKAKGHEHAAKRLEELKPEVEKAQLESKDISIDDVLKELDELVGIEPVKKDIRKLIDFFKLQAMKKAKGLPVATSSYHCVFSGSPGTGKTTVARIMARAYKALGVTKTSKLVETQRVDLVAEYVGQTAPKTNEIVNKALDGVLFIDEAYSLDQGYKSDFGHEAVDTLLKRMEDDRDRLVVIVAGYTDEMHKFIDMNPGLKSRFTRYINFPDYSADELTEIVVRMGKKEGYAFAKDAIEAVRSCMVEMVEKKEKGFGNAREARTFFDRVKERQAPRVLAIGDAVTKEQMMEILPCDVSDTAGQKEGTKFRHDYRFDAYAPDQSHDILEQPALLAAYVLPQDADVKRLQAKASDLLGRMTNNPSIDAYQGDCERVAKICRALFETVRDKYIHYAEAPADFGLPGQKLRLPHEIMKYKLATCLDTTLLLAALAEACKLHPVIVLVQGHAYLGVFLAKKNLSEAVVRKPDELRRFCHANEMVMIETTGVCHGVTFAAACETGWKHLFEGDDGDFECAIDVVQAHSYGVRQLSLGMPDDEEDRKVAAKEVPVAHGAKRNESGGLTEAKLAKMKKPAALLFDGEKVANVSTWKELFQKAYERLNALDASKFDALPDDAAFSKYFIRLAEGKKTPHDCFKVKLGSRGDIRAHELANKVYLWRTDYYFRKLLDRLGVDSSRLDVL